MPIQVRAQAQQGTADDAHGTSAGSPKPANPKPAQPEKKDRIFGVIPNYRTVERPGHVITPITAKQKFGLAVQDGFDPYAYFIAGAFAGVGQAQNDPRSWGQGWGAFGKRYAASFADQTDEDMMTEAVIPVLLSQDPRYFRMAEGGVLKRTAYAISRISATRTDAGHRAFNFSEILGAGISSAISNAYYPGENRTASKTLDRWGILLGEDTVFNILKEFWPDVRKKIVKR